LPRFKLTIEYAGTRYSGWQIQQNARTIQGEVERALREVTARNDFELYASGRTDAGVHAAGQVAHLDVATNLPADTLRHRINDELPSDINILAADVVPHRFHARHDAVARRYVYQVSRRRTAFSKAFVWWVKDPLDIGRMQAAAARFVGKRDFGSFAERDRASSPRERSTIVAIDRVDVVEDGDLVLVTVEGSHFLWKMVRRLVGVIVEVGRGRLEVDGAAALLTSGPELPARLTAPASGLFLARVFYPNDRRDVESRAITPL
jgi:tRNA pseudouridine38-40 synthase